MCSAHVGGGLLLGCGLGVLIFNLKPRFSLFLCLDIRMLSCKAISNFDVHAGPQIRKTKTVS